MIVIRYLFLSSLLYDKNLAGIFLQGFRGTCRIRTGDLCHANAAR